ncbi:hcpC [Symbiodinium sp. CCMP2592]|nr:hcpC [Symbiodinium sp. CCMP2592]
MELSHTNPDLVPQELGLSALAGTKLHRFLRGFQEGVFQEEVDEFVKRHASHFAVVCPDGSFPLLWKQLHDEYKELFDQQLEAILWFQDSDKDSFLTACSRLRAASAGLDQDSLLPDIFPDDAAQPGFRDLRVADFRAFMPGAHESRVQGLGRDSKGSKIGMDVAGKIPKNES